MNAEEAVTIACQLWTYRRVETVSVSGTTEAAPVENLSAHVGEDGRIFIKRGFDNFVEEPLPPGDYEVTASIGRQRDASSLPVAFRTVDDFLRWKNNRNAVEREQRTAKGNQDRQRVTSERERNQDQKGKVDYLLRVANYKNRTFTFAGKGPSCRGCGYAFEDRPTRVWEVVENHSQSCPALPLIQSTAKKWETESSP